jgi:hypothetical protein
VTAIWSFSAVADADGPDFFRVQNVVAGSVLPVSAEPRAGARGVGTISSDTQCLRNLGCRGGLSLEDFNALSKGDQGLLSAADPRWCRVQYGAMIGWVEGRFLAEGDCTTASKPSNHITIDFPRGRNKVVMKGRIQGNNYTDYLVRVLAGQVMAVNLRGTHPQNYFNVLPPGSEDAAMFIGSSAGNQFERIAPVDGVYVVRTYLMRAAARRNAVSNYALQIGVTGQGLKPVPAKQDAVIPGTPFHASGSIPCKVDLNPALQRCEAYVIRRSFDGTATVEVRWTLGASAMVRRVLMIKGAPVSTDSPSEFGFVREGDELVLTIGTEEQYRIPDALVVGG